MYLPSVSYIPGTVLGTGVILAQQENASPMEFTFSWGEVTTNNNAKKKKGWENRVGIVEGILQCFSIKYLVFVSVVKIFLKINTFIFVLWCL